MTAEDFHSSEPFKRVTTREALDLVNSQGGIVVDVRTVDEYNQKHLRDSVFVPLDELLNRHRELPSNRPLLFLCRTGMRSALAAEFSAALGFDPGQLYNVEGGIVDWEREALPNVNYNEQEVS